MDNKRSREAAIEFLEYMAQKGLMAPATARARKAALGKVLGILDKTDAQDVTSINLDDVMTRFSHLQGKNYTPDSLGTYKSRVKAALDDFNSYVGNPLAFKPSVQTRDRKPSSGKASSGEIKKKSRETTSESFEQSMPVVTRPMANSIIPIPIRADLTVHIQGLPFDLTEAEANKIASVVRAMTMLA